MIQQGRPFSFVSKFVLKNCTRKNNSPNNQIGSASSSHLIGRYLGEGLDVCMGLTVTKVFSLFQRVEVHV